MTRVVFLDRDGTLNTEVGYLADPQRLQLLPGVPQALRRLVDHGYRLVVVTNQSGIARGYFDEARLARIHEQLQREVGGLLWALLHCPHLPDGGHGYGGACECRKPKAGLLQQARELLGIDLAGAVLIGDSARDLLMAAELPLRRIYVESGKPATAELATLRAAGVTPQCIAKDLPAAADWLLSAS